MMMMFTFSLINTRGSVLLRLGIDNNKQDIFWSGGWDYRLPRVEAAWSLNIVDCYQCSLQ